MQKLAFVCVTLLAVTEVANCLRKGIPVEQEDAPTISPKSDLRFVARAPRYYPEDATTVVGLRLPYCMTPTRMDTLEEAASPAKAGYRLAQV
jgi:hypothetical protein